MTKEELQKVYEKVSEKLFNSTHEERKLIAVALIEEEFPAEEAFLGICIALGVSAKTRLQTNKKYQGRRFQ